jgi:hypothetical protein
VTEASGLPVLSPAIEAWFTSGKVNVQRCDACGTLQHPPDEVCHACGATTFGVQELSPRGTVVSLTVVHHAPNRELRDVVPYTIVLVSLDDAPQIRVVGNIEGEARIGMPVEAYWEDFDTEDETAIRLIQWRPARS